MNEQEQAQRLADWLEDPNATTPEGLDSDVVESVVALRPELGPAPRITADDILAGITEGPLAGGLPAGASLAAPPEAAPMAGDSDRRRPWWYAALGVGGLSSVAVAAAVLLVVGVVTVNSLGPDGTVAMEPLAAPEADAVAMGGDTGTATRRSPVAKPAARPRPAARPQPAMRKPTETPAEQKLYDDAPAVADIAEEEEDDFVDDGELDFDASDEDAGAVIPEVIGSREERAPAAEGAPSAPRPTPGSAAPASAPAPMAPTAPPPPPEAEPELGLAPQADYATGGASPSVGSDSAPPSMKEMTEVTAGVEANRGFSGSIESEPAKVDREAERRRRREERQAKREQSKGAGAPRAPSAAPMDDRMVDEELAEDTSPSEVQIARQAIQSGNPDQALPVIEQGLARYPDDMAVRETLYRLKGDALTALGRIDEAREAYLDAQRAARQR